MDDILDIQRHKPIYISEGMSLAFALPGGLMAFFGFIFGAAALYGAESILWSRTFFGIAITGGLSLFLHTGMAVLSAPYWGTYINLLGMRVLRKRKVPKSAIRFELYSTRHRRKTYAGYFFPLEMNSVSTTYEVQWVSDSGSKVMREFIDYQVAYKFLEAIAEAHQLPARDHVHEARKSALKRRRFRRR